MIFLADNHYGTHAGRILYERLKELYPIKFFEEDWSCLNPDLRADRVPLLILNFISGSGDQEMPPPAAEDQIRAYLESGGNLLLLHGGSAAFWQWWWWRNLVGLRWVRPDDPDDAPPSIHPIRSYVVRPAQGRHPLLARLKEVEVREDELYMNLDQTGPVTTLMEAETAEGLFPQCYVAGTPWGGRLAGYLPGHAPGVVGLPANIENCRVLIEWLMEGARRPRESA